MDARSALARQLATMISDQRVLAAIAALPRDLFVPEDVRSHSYENVALPIACEQTISQPLVVARMLETLELRPSDRVLDVGTGSGYHAALLALLCERVWTVERHAELTAFAQQAIATAGITNVEFFVGDGYEGLQTQAPFDAINVAAAAEESGLGGLESQLAPGGRMVVPVGATDQYLVLSRRTALGLKRRRLEPVRFVPLVRGSLDREAPG